MQTWSLDLQCGQRFDALMKGQPNELTRPQGGTGGLPTPVKWLLVVPLLAFCRAVLRSFPAGLLLSQLPSIQPKFGKVAFVAGF